MIRKKDFLSIILLFAVLFVLFMFSILSTSTLSRPETNDRGNDVSDIGSNDALLYTAFRMENGSGPLMPNVSPGLISDDILIESTFQNSTVQHEQILLVANNPQAVLIGEADYDLEVLEEWCIYNKYRYRAYTSWPEVHALQGADVVIVGRMKYEGAILQILQAYAQTGTTMLFTRLPEYELLVTSPALANFFGIAQCVDPAYRVDGLKVFADFFISRERIYSAGDFYGERDDTEVTLPYYTLRNSYEGYMVGLLNNQEELEIENEELPTLLWRTYTGQSQVYVVNTDLFQGERMLGVITAFMSKARDWYLYPVINARTIVMTNFPFLSNENTETIHSRYSRDTLGFQRDIIWPNVVKIFINYKAVPNFFLSPGMSDTDVDFFTDDDLTLYLKQMNVLSGTIGLSLMQTTGYSLRDMAGKAAEHFSKAVLNFRFYAAYSGDFSDIQWREYIQAGQDALLSDLSVVLFPYREKSALFSFIGEQVLSARMTNEGFSHETMDDLQLISLMTALGYNTQHVDILRALFPTGDEDDWSNLSLMWSKGDTYYRDYAKFDNTSVYAMEARVRRMLGSNYTCMRSEDSLHVTINPFQGQLWFILRLHGEEIIAVTGGEATKLSDTAYLIRADQADLTVSLACIHYLHEPD